MADGRSSASVASVIAVALTLSLAGGLVTLTVAGEPRCGVLVGRVVDRDGRPVEGAFVTVPTVDGEGTRRVRTGSDGYFRAARVPVGYHVISVQRRGYRFREAGTGSLQEGRKLLVPLIKLDPARDSLSMSVAYPLVVATGGRKRMYLSGVCSEETARVRFSIHPYDLVKERLLDLRQGAGPGFERRQRLVEHPEKLPPPVWSWERSYSTSELDGGFDGYPATPRLDRPGTYLVVAALGSVTAGDVLNVTSLALVTKRDADGVLVWTTDIRSGKPAGGAAVEVHTRGAGPADAVTGEQGLARIPLQGDESLVVARREGSTAFTLAHYYPGGYNEGSLIYTDRPLYRPGHTVHFKGIFRRSLPGSYECLSGRDVEFLVQDPEGRNVGKVSASTNDFGTAAASWQIPDDAPLGDYRVRVKLDGRETDARFSVDEYRKPEYAVEVSMPQPFCARGDTVTASVRANYYFGAPVADAEVSYTVYRSRWYFRLFDSEFESWFDRFAGRYGYDYGGYGEVVLEGTGRTDASGQLDIRLDTSQEEELARWVVEARVVDISLREVTASAGITVTPADFDVQGEPRQYLASPGAPVAVDVRTVDWTGRAVPRRRVEAVVERMRWRRSTVRTEEVARFQLSTDREGRGVLEWTPATQGEYRITLRSRDDRGRTAASEAFIRVVSPGEREFYGEGPPGEDLTIVRDRRIYRPGDTAKVLVRSPSRDAYVLVTVEGTRLHDARVSRLEGGGLVLDVPLDNAQRPGVTVSCLYVRDGQMRSAEEDLAVSPEDSFLTVELSSSRDRYRPGDEAEFTLRTLDSRGKGVRSEVSLGVVDEAIYALRADNTPDIRRHFWGPRYNRVTTSSSIEDYYWGGVDKFEDAVRRDFRDTAFWAPQILTDDEGRASVRFRLPDNLTTWRATARAVTEDTAVGSAVHRCIVTKDVLVRLQAPRFFRQRDRQTLGVIVHNYTPERRRVRVSLSAKGLEIKGSAGRTVTVDAQGAVRVPVEVEVREPGEAVLTARADGGSRDASDAMEVRFPVHPHGVSVSVGRAGAVPARDVVFTIPPEADAASAELKLEFTPSAAGAIVSGLEYLAAYPWGCVEQVTSSFVPDVVVKRAMDRLGIRKPAAARELPEMLRRGVRLLREAQNGDGSWGWHGEGSADLQMTAYVLFALQEARDAGAEVPPEMLARGSSWLTGALFRGLPPPPDSRDLPRVGEWYRSRLEEFAFALAALPPSGDAQRALFRELWVRQPQLTDFALACLGMAAAKQGWAQELTDAATALQGRKQTESGMVFWRGSPAYSGWGGPAATAMAMRVLARAGRTTAELEPAAAWLMMQRNGDHWRSTRDTSLVILALVEHLERLPTAGGRASVLVNGRPAGSVTLTREDAYGSPRVVRVPGGILRKGANTVTIRRDGQGTLFWSAVLTYVDSQEDLPAAPGYFRVTRAFQRVRLERRPDGSVVEKVEALKGRVRVGETLRMRVRVTPRSDMRYVLVECPLPSGFEVVDRPRPWDVFYSGIEVRDERVGIFSRELRGGWTQVFDFEVRAEVPGELHVMPVRAFAMYTPQLAGRSPEARLAVR